MEVVVDKDVTAYEKLRSVSKSYEEFITESIKQPVLSTPVLQSTDQIIQELVDVSAAHASHMFFHNAVSKSITSFLSSKDGEEKKVWLTFVHHCSLNFKIQLVKSLNAFSKYFVQIVEKTFLFICE